MAIADTASYDELVVEVEFVPASGTYTTICGLKGASVTRTKNVDSDEVPDCADESLPWSVSKDTRSIEVTISGTAAWALISHKSMHQWFYETGVGSGRLNVQIRNAKVEADGSAGDPIIESGAAILSSLSNEKEKGKVITADIEIEFVTVPTVTDKS